MTRLLALALILSGCQATRIADADPPVGQIVTPAEESGYTRTSTYLEVVDLLERLEAVSALEVGSFGTSVEGRELPLVVIGADAATPEAVLEAGKTRVLVFANIHAGEVAGKDAMLEMLRDVAASAHSHWSDSLVVMIAPIYNADGNERMELDNRSRQDGPVEGMGQRPNAQDLDLNRDFMKVASPEARALVGLIRDADPHVVVDLHTTNGTHMGYHLTYAPGLSPNTPLVLDADLRERWLPAITDSLLAHDDFATYHYGNVPGAFGEEATAPRGWYSFSAQPRFSTNYAGLRGRYAILSEAYSYATFQERVAVSRRFTEEILDRAWAEASRISRTVLEVDQSSAVGMEIALRSTWAALDEPVEILLGDVDTLQHPVTGSDVFRRRDAVRTEVMPAFVRFEAVESVVAPLAYVVTGAAIEPVREILDVHGISHRLG
ncbi:M14 family metallopeptidase, partial [Rubrivirga sp.]|uniref:M14 family metallopeptidase n=1 Tax=Rubrivirga sp. TaxID=1885344 RepID=UPI003C72AA4F